MTYPREWDSIIGLTAVDAAGDKIGKVSQIYLDDATGEPAWVTVSTGLFGTRESFAPLYGSSVRDGQLVLAVPRDLVGDAPRIENDGQLSDAETSALYQHYAAHLGAQGGRYAGRHQESEQSSAADRDTSGPVTDDAMTRSEERLHVGTESVPAGRARLRKYVVTETVTTSVPVSHEEVRLEREPITDDNRDAALAGPDISEEEHEITLQAERPVVAKETVPVERVRLSTETVTNQQQVTEQVRKEHIDEPEIDTDPRGHTG